MTVEKHGCLLLSLQDCSEKHFYLSLSMTIILKKGATRLDLEKALSKLEKNKRKPSAKKYFGALKRGVDGLKYQKEIRREN